MAPSQIAARVQTGTRLADDSRADHGTRLVTLAADMIQIERIFRGMKMRIHVPIESYLGVSLWSRSGQQGKTYEIRLAHRDAELAVQLESTADHEAAADLCRHWAAFFGRPVLEERPMLLATSTAHQEPPKSRRRCWTTVAKRRPRRVMRRKGGNLENLATIRQGEREIICYE